MQKTLGGDRLGSGKKMKVDLHGYERSTHDLGYLWRSTMSAGTLVPFMSEIALPGDTFDINLGCVVLTHPTIGPLFGSYKVQLDIFQCPIRLYNSLLHNNALGIGLKMNNVKLPTITLSAVKSTTPPNDVDNSQINPSALLSYLGIRGIGYNSNSTASSAPRTFNAVPILAYWDIYKQYYSNKMEEIGAYIIYEGTGQNRTVTTITVTYPDGSTSTIQQTPTNVPVILTGISAITIAYTGTPPTTDNIIFNSQTNGPITADQLVTLPFTDSGTELTAMYNSTRWGTITINNWNYLEQNTPITTAPQVSTFTLTNIDDMRNAILAYNSTTTPFDIGTTPSSPILPYYALVSYNAAGVQTNLGSQNGLGLKTYQSDLLNNWLQTEYIDGPGGITAVTAVSTAGGSFTIDTLNLSKKVYDMLNRIAVSGGTYDDWLDAVYAHEKYQRCETPMYMGGLSKELVFQEVISNSESGNQPLGTLAGRGTMSNKHKGGNVIIKVDEPSYIIGIVSLTPRLDYSQGNKWDTGLKTLDDLHKPALDEIGFQELIMEQAAWWSTRWDNDTEQWVQSSAGKQPAWINYMTNINQTRGNFAISTNEMFMTLNRRYEFDSGLTSGIADMTTYIDPSKFNFIFAQTSLDSQNFWTQIAVDITARRKMSAKIMPNL